MFKCLGLDFHQEWDRLFAAHFWFSKLMDLKKTAGSEVIWLISSIIFWGSVFQFSELTFSDITLLFIQESTDMWSLIRGPKGDSSGIGTAAVAILTDFFCRCNVTGLFFGSLAPHLSYSLVQTCQKQRRQIQPLLKQSLICSPQWKSKEQKADAITAQIKNLERP